MKTIVKAILKSLPPLRWVMLLLIMFVLIYGIIGVQLFAGVLVAQCHYLDEESGTWQVDDLQGMFCGMKYLPLKFDLNNPDALTYDTACDGKYPCQVGETKVTRVANFHNVETLGKTEAACQTSSPPAVSHYIMIVANNAQLPLSPKNL